MRFAVIAAMIATVSAAAGDACGKGSGAGKDSCGATACCGKTNTGDKVCSLDDTKANPDEAKYTDFVCMEGKGGKDGATNVGVSAAVVVVMSALYLA